jgi:hypothetical protein
MRRLHLSVVFSALLLGAAPASALGISLDLPRLDFPAPQPDTSRDCPTLSTATPACTPKDK